MLGRLPLLHLRRLDLVSAGRRRRCGAKDERESFSWGEFARIYIAIPGIDELPRQK